VRFLLVVLGASAGAPVRFLVDRWAREHSRAGTVLGTLLVNVAGTFLLGVLSGWSTRPAWVMPLLGFGFCGALTTFSTLTLETWVLLEERRWRPFAANLGLHLLLGAVAVVAGWAVGDALA
jgi:CrcB protein